MKRVLEAISLVLVGALLTLCLGLALDNAFRDPANASWLDFEPRTTTGTTSDVSRETQSIGDALDQCQEDEPCWEWDTMGNRQRGDGGVAISARCVERRVRPGLPPVWPNVQPVVVPCLVGHDA